MKKRLISWLLCVAMIAGLIPAAAATALASSLSGVQSLSDSYISVSVSEKNGGFTVTTVEGDRLKKSDNNKNLLYHDGQYDTSFLSFRVGEGTEAKDYIFGGKYTGSSSVKVEKSSAGDSITATWSVDDLTFTQTISLANRESNESGMVSIIVGVKNEGAPRKVQARLLLDTCLGDQDYGYYQYVEGTNTVTVDSETVITENLPKQLYAADTVAGASVMAYTVHNSTASLTKMAFGHWSHLASTLFDFEPVSTLNFTNTRSEYATADSAYALYYDLGSISSGDTQSVNTYYGVFSNYNTPAENSVAVNVTAPVKLSLNDDKTDYVRQENVGIADFSVAVDFSNIASETAVDLSHVRLVVRTSSNLRSLNDQGEENACDFDGGVPFTADYTNVAVGESNNKTLYFEGRLTANASYEKITIGVYDVSDGGELSESNKLGERVCYILLPGTDSDAPKVNFAAMTPKIVYTSGTRHLYVSVTDNLALLDVDASARKWNLYASSDNTGDMIAIDHSNISFKDGVMDVAIPAESEMAEGSWHLMLMWDGSVVGTGEGQFIPSQYAVQTSPALQFTVSSDIQYKNDSYGLLVVAEYDVTDDKAGNVAPGTLRADARMYRILTFKDEDDFAQYKANPITYENGKYKKFGAFTEIIFVLKGEFSVSKTVSGTSDATYYTAISKKVEDKDGKTKIDNPVQINNCLDFEKGTISVYYEDYTSSRFMDSAICIEFDGSLYTSGARTSVWTGKAAFTRLNQYSEDYSLVPYNQDGERISINHSTGEMTAGDGVAFEDTPVTLIWPTLAGTIGQTLSGMVFKLAYGQMGIMYDVDDSTKKIGDELGTVISFAAELSLSFATGHTDDYDENNAKETYWTKLKRIWEHYTDTSSVYAWEGDFLRVCNAFDWSDIDEEDLHEDEKRISASVMVRDVVFGCGEGFIGVNFKVSVGLQNYISALPSIQGTISVNTINDWSFGINGEVELSSFKLEAEISFKSKNNVPIPDNLYIFFSGFEPGVNIDGCGVLWITGGGGGISNLYNTIFCTQTVPPLKLVMSISFDVLKVLTCEKATLSVGATGISLAAENIGPKYPVGVETGAIDYMGLSLEWYPGIDLRASIRLNLFWGVIYGAGYMVLISPDYHDVFFEMFARAELRLPNSIPLVGGMKIAGVDLGINSEKIWGAIEVLCFTLGVTYYWGDDSVDFSDGSKSSPTFPELLGYEDIPVAYDEESGQTLYMRVGTNTQVLATNLDDDGGLVLMAANPGVSLKSDAAKTTHQFNFGTKGNDNAIVQITFDVPGTYATEEAFAAKAKELAQQITVKDSGNQNYGLVWYNENANNAATCNANLSYAYETGKATVVISATEPEQYGKNWTLTTPESSDVLLYNVAAMPEVTEVSGTINAADSGKIDLSWIGSELTELDQISFYLTADNTVSNDPEGTVDPGYRIDVVSDSTTLGGKITTLTVPADVPSGTYYIRAVYSKENEVNGVVFSTGTVNWVNNNTPGTVSYTAEAAGNLQYELILAPDSTGKTDGYLITIYDADGNATDFEQLSYQKAESGNTVIKVGGSYQTTDKNGDPITDENGDPIPSFGLTGGQTYTIGVTPYKTVTSSNGEIAVRGTEVKTSVYLPESAKPIVTLTANQLPQARTETVTDAENTFIDTTEKDVYTTNAITFTASISEPVSGTWKLNSGSATSFSNTAVVSIPLTDLDDGEHTITIEGKAADGDSFYQTFTFVVDTMPPQLLLSSPLNGSFYSKDGKVTITGITDPGALFTITCDNDVICSQKAIEELDVSFDKASGVFSATLDIPNPNKASQKTLSITVSDDVGNATTRSVTLSHGGLADLQSLEIMVNGTGYAEGNIPIPATGLADAQLTLVGVMTDGTKFNLTDCNVIWEILTVEGTAGIDGDKLTAAALSQGIITAKLAVAEGYGQGSTIQEVLKGKTSGTAIAYRTASLCFGAPENHTVYVSSGLGGSAAGGGTYAPGSTVTLTATPDSGYRFAGWSIVGVTVENTSSATITFTMPQTGNVTAEACFEPVSQTIVIPTETDSRYAQSGQLIGIDIPAGESESNLVPYYFNDAGEKVYVPISAVNDGCIYFIAPQTGKYYFEANNVNFTDISGRWSEESILFTACRNIFKGVGNDRFDPTRAMDRTMVVTVLYRLAGSPTVSGESSYADIGTNKWYSDAVQWGELMEIVKGYGNGTFGVEDTITREQLCTMIVRFIKCMGYDLPVTEDAAAFTDTNDISSWAVDSVTYCQTRGLIYGMPDGSFSPETNTTREQCCAVMERLIRAVLAAK